MKRKEPRESNVVVQVIDTDSLCEAASEKMKETMSGVTGATISGSSKWGFVKKDDKLIVINNEGVGDEVTNEEPLVLQFHALRKKAFELFPCMAIKLNPKAIEAMYLTGTENLATFIRSFGSRLEANFNMWNRELS